MEDLNIDDHDRAGCIGRQMRLVVAMWTTARLKCIIICVLELKLLYSYQEISIGIVG